MKNIIRKIICDLIGHSHIVYGYDMHTYCARCADCLDGYIDQPICLFYLGSDDKHNYTKMTWKDKLLVPRYLK